LTPPENLWGNISFAYYKRLVLQINSIDHIGFYYFSLTGSTRFSGFGYKNTMKKRYKRSTTIPSASLDFHAESGIAISRLRPSFQRTG
jgi:hypothetical protein